MNREVVGERWEEDESSNRVCNAHICSLYCSVFPLLIVMNKATHYASVSPSLEDGYFSP